MPQRNGLISQLGRKCPRFHNHFSAAQKWVKAGYWYSGSDFPISDINSALFTHLICAFANVNSSTYELSIPPNSEQNFSIFTASSSARTLQL
uniref:GH18 domain-containing protein n=1 Tax=Salix viminalis TaxID=40686 RepID=A0A6N2M8L8_SALVM